MTEARPQGTTRDRWARAEKTALVRARRDGERRDLRAEWRAFHLRLADSHDRIAADHREKARALTLSDEAGGGSGV